MPDLNGDALSQPSPLPVEVVAHVVRLLGEDSSNFDRPSGAAQALAALSLVNSKMRALAQPELFRTVTLRSRGDADRFLAAVEDGSEKPCQVARLVRSLRIGGVHSSWGRVPFAAEELGLNAILRICTGLTELKLAQVDNVNLTALRAAQDLRSLYLWSCSDVHWTPPLFDDLDDLPRLSDFKLTLPRLEWLYLTDLTISPNVLGPFLSPSTTPALKSLAYTLCEWLEDQGPPEPNPRFVPSEAPILHQLRCLSTSYPILPTFETCDNLVLLDCWVDSITSTNILNLPPSLRFLRFNSPQFDGPSAQQFVQAWEAKGSALGALEEIVVPSSYEKDAEFDGLRQVCSKRSVKLTYEFPMPWEDDAQEGEDWKMTEEAAFDHRYWSLVKRVEALLDHEERIGST